MRWLTCLAVIAIAFAAAILGPLAFSAHQKMMPQAASGGELTYRFGTFVMRLTDEPCPFEELDEHLTEQAVPPAKAYRVQERDGRWSTPGCWATDMGGDMMTMDTAGGEGMIPKERLSRE